MDGLKIYAVARFGATPASRDGCKNRGRLEKR